jgi:hypothetical protein
MVGRLVLAAVAVPKLAAGEQHFEHLTNIAAGRLKPIRQLLDERRRRFVGDKILGQFEADMTRRRRALRQDVERLLAFRLAVERAAADRKTGAEIVTSALEHRSVLRKFAGIGAIDAPAGEDPRQRHDIVLAVTTIGAERVELHHFPGEILVEPDLIIPPAWARG